MQIYVNKEKITIFYNKNDMVDKYKRTHNQTSQEGSESATAYISTTIQQYTQLRNDGRRQRYDDDDNGRNKQAVIL